MNTTHSIRKVGLAAVLLVVAAVSATPARADSLRCGGSLVQKGDPAAAVRSNCGEPDFVDPWIGGVDIAYGAVPNMEAWTYNRGPGRLLQVLVFRDGRLDRIREDGYGFRVPAGSGECQPAGITPGMSKYRLLVACGQPAQKSGGYVLSTRGSQGVLDYRRRGVVPVYREQWIYNFGSSRLLREVTLENAVVVETDTLDRGYDD